MRAENPDLVHIGHNVKVARLEKGWTQEELAVQLGEASGASADRGYISRIEGGGHNPSAVTLIRLARALDITPETLLDGIK